ncbi:hypothetical protein GCM10007036_08070 [Alsobacter metallidurans]|uniref:DUF3300 domain-containing protein n=1 Tax=Alsobacter metallidurans TaxID=340221 RepID=A0A917I521_9HYPH|nr:DUF3300 domain-containing protein [Alsobacter metallidurans]GGH11191.1 hypothetical protein GCM10007036_08070 [Alsobacter metallidurans]
MTPRPFTVSILTLLLAAGSQEIRAQTAPATTPPASGPSAPVNSPPSPIEASGQANLQAFSRSELETLLKPIALYPDVLLAQLLPASAYPLEIVQAARWLDRNKAAVQKSDYSAADAQNWDPSVKAMLRFPDLIRRMNDDLDWTSDLGDAFVHQPNDVAQVIQSLRAAAEKTGALKSSKEQTVTRRQESGKAEIVIEPADPEVVYVPAYETTVYDPGYSAVGAGLIGFGAGVVVGSLVNNASWNWGTGVVYPPVWPGYPGYRPPPPRPPGVRPPGGLPGAPGSGLRPGGGGAINIGNDINIGGGNLVGNAKPWRPDPDRYRPGQGSKPGLSRPIAPGAGVRPGDGPGGPRPAALPARDGRPGAGGIGAAAAGGALAGAAASARPRAETRPAERGGQAAQRPATSQKPAARPKPVAKAPSARPAQPVRPPTAFGGMDMGRGAASFGARGASSRAQAGFGGGSGMRGGGSAMRGGGGGMRGGGGGGRGGGGRRR